MKRYRRENEQSYTLGATLTYELLHYKIESVEGVYLHSKCIKNEAYDRICRICQEHGIPITYNDKVFHILDAKENCFIIGEFRKYESRICEDENHILLVNPSDSGNAGTIMRSALGFGIKNMALILPAVDIFSPKTIRASMGAIFGLEIEYFQSITQYQERFPQQHNYPFMLDAKTELRETHFQEPYTLIFGNEATGLPKDYQELGESVIIAHEHTIDSLNLPIAASIAMYVAASKGKIKLLEEGTECHCN
ncbi:MAG: TrmH family RNA methyltransferase [Lachnospiraceae bacterium]